MLEVQERELSFVPSVKPAVMEKAKIAMTCEHEREGGWREGGGGRGSTGEDGGPVQRVVRGQGEQGRQREGVTRAVCSDVNNTIPERVGQAHYR